MPTDFEARKVAAMPIGEGEPRSMSLSGARAVMVKRYETHVRDTVADMTGTGAHAQRSAVELIDRAAITHSPHRFRRNECHRGAVNGAIASPSGSPLVRIPIAIPSGIEHLDFSLQCRLAFLDNRFRCDRPAAAYVEFHMVGYCKRFDCNEDGNACGYVCAGHLEALEYTAECIARGLQPAAPVRGLSRRVVRCPTCDRSIRSASDILQVVVML